MNDLDAVRRPAAEPTDQPAKRRRLVLVLSGLAVLALIAASLVIYRVKQGEHSPVASKPEAVASLNSMADIAYAAPPLIVQDGYSVRTESRGQGGACSPTATCQLKAQDRDQVFDPRQGVTLRLMDGGRDLLGGLGAWAPPKVGIERPTFEWLTSLPIDSQEMLAALRKEVGHHDSWSVDHQLWDAMGQLYSYCEIALSAPQRAFFLRALAGVTGLSKRDLVVDGVPLVAIRQTDRDSGVEIIFDPATGHAVGRASVFLNNPVTIVAMEGAPPLDKGVVYQVTWKQTLTRP